MLVVLDRGYPRKVGGALGRKTEEEDEGLGGGVGFLESRWRMCGPSANVMISCLRTA